MSDVLSVNIDKEKLKLPEKMAKEERSDRSKVARRILDEGMKKRKLDMAVAKFTEGRVSLWKTAGLAELSEGD